jgi:hypothetical protein
VQLVGGEMCVAAWKVCIKYTRKNYFILFYWCVAVDQIAY